MINTNFYLAPDLYKPPVCLTSRKQVSIQNYRHRLDDESKKTPCIISNANTQMIKDQIKFYCIIQFVTFGWKLPDIKFSSDLIKFHFIYILEANWNNLIRNFWINRMCLDFLALKCCHIMWWWTQSLQFGLQLQFVWCSLRVTQGLMVNLSISTRTKLIQNQERKSKIISQPKDVLSWKIFWNQYCIVTENATL